MSKLPYRKGYLSVGDNHKLYYEAYGDKTKAPILFLHGGPGAGFSESSKFYFNFRKQHVIFFDQRGAGKSKPFASIKHNTTQKLVSDINKIIAHFKLEKVMLFGGSWGSTLALCYAIAHPEKVSAMVLRGIFLGDKKSTDYYVRGGVKEYYPDVWARFISHVPKSEQKNPLNYYFQQLIGKDKKRAQFFAYEWSYYELSLCFMKYSPKIVKAALGTYPLVSLATLEAHYIKNNNFISEGYILKNAKRIADIPTIIVQGRHDVVCPPWQAYELSKKLKNARLTFMNSGHSSTLAMKKKLKREVEKMCMKVQEK